MTLRTQTATHDPRRQGHRRRRSRPSCAERVAALQGPAASCPGSARCSSGADPGSQLVRRRQAPATAPRSASTSIRVDLPADATQDEVEARDPRAQRGPGVHRLHRAAAAARSTSTPNAILERIDPDKDADGLHPTNLGPARAQRQRADHSPLPCTPARRRRAAARATAIDLAGKHVVVVGRGVTVGRPLGLLLTRSDVNATVTLTHTGTVDLAGTSCGRPTSSSPRPACRTSSRPTDVKPGAAVLDVGVTRCKTRRPARPGRRRRRPGRGKVAGHLSPNPGGVGPMTRAMLLANVVEAAELRLNR